MGDGRRLARGRHVVHDDFQATDDESVVTRQETVEVHLEELGQHSWVKTLANTVGGSFGNARYRFAACSPGKEHHARDQVGTGATFPVMRLQDLENLNQPNAWIETAQERLEELDEELLGRGWRRDSNSGQHWWSRTYIISRRHRRRPAPRRRPSEASCYGELVSPSFR
jgi:hypothetical protein